MIELAFGVGSILALVAATWIAVQVVANRESHVELEPYSLRYELWPNQPWRSRLDADTIGLVPTWWLHANANPAELAAAARHAERLDGLRPSIASIGIHTPLVVAIDQLGRLCVADGHHRLVIAHELGLTLCPVKVKAVSRIGGYGVAVGPAVADLVTRRGPAAGGAGGRSR